MTPLAQPRGTTKQFDLANVIGRFQGAQEGHWDVINTALEVAQHVRIMVGSANVARDTRNPFTYEERLTVLKALIAQRCQPHDVGRFSFVPLNDTPYDKHAWITAVTTAARSATKALRPRIALVGNIRDETSEYLNWFPTWTYVPVRDSGSNATAIRKAFFSGAVNFESKGWTDGFDWSTVPEPTVEFLRDFRDKPVYAHLMEQLAAETAYKAKWGSGPFQTVDPVILKGDHILMIERGGPEGTGAIGLPGGFLNAGERTMWAAAREAVEETGIFVEDTYVPAMLDYLTACKEAEKAGAKPPALPIYMVQAIRTLLSYQRGQGERFDDPNRSRRGHLITEAYLFQLPDGHGLPRVLGMDDAKAAFWMPTSELSPTNTFEDHAHIADFMISRYATF